MSYFIFGRIYQAQPHESKDKELLDIAEATSKVGLFGRFDQDIHQNIISEMLNKQAIQGSVLCSFLLTAGKKDDTSDSIISPYQLNESELIERLSKVEQWVTGLVQLLSIARVDLYITEGYENSFKIISAVDRGWGKRLAEAIYKESYVESVCIQLPAESPSL